MSVALPRLMVDFEVDATTVQWVTGAFLLTMAVVIPITGFLLQRFPTRTVFLAALTLFSTGTLISLLAPVFSLLIVGRVVQATGTAITLPLLMTTVLTLVPPARRGRMMGNISIVIAVAPAIGPTLSGVILGLGSWRLLFGVVLPIALAMLVYGFKKIENVSTTRNVPLDVFSVTLSAFGFGGIVYGLSELGNPNGSALTIALSIGVGVVALVSFVLRQRVLQRSDIPLLDLRVFRFRIFAVAVTMMGISMLTLFGTLILLPLYLQNVLGLTPLVTGLIVLPGGLIMGLAAPGVGRLYDRFGPRVLLVPGTTLLSSVLWAFTRVTQDTSPFMILAGHVILSIGLALLFTPLFSAGLGSLTPRLYSHGSAIFSTLQQLAAAAGTAIFVTVMAGRASALGATGVGDAAASAGGVRAAFLVGAIVSLGAIVAAFFIRKPDDDPVDATGQKTSEPAPEAEPEISPTA